MYFFPTHSFPLTCNYLPHIWLDSSTDSIRSLSANRIRFGEDMSMLQHLSFHYNFLDPALSVLACYQKISYILSVINFGQ